MNALPRSHEGEPTPYCPPIVWEPTPKQSMLLACDDFEVLYGGAAGGGKSDALLIDAWCGQFEGPRKPLHRAVLFRKNFPDLKDLIDRSHDLYPAFIKGAKYNKQDHIWTAPSGAKVEFAYLENDRDRLKYRGRAWNYIGFDELTLWATDKCWVYLMSRCRTVDRTLPRYLRATTNPDGPGQKWVMERFAIDIEGMPTVQEREVVFELLGPDGRVLHEKRKIIRRFIPAKLSENPHLLGSGYRETLMDMPEEEKENLLNGRWTGNRVHGAIYIKQMQKARAEGRITTLQALQSVPVNTFWDLGWNDATAVWFHQYAALANRFLHSYEISGATVEAMVSYLQAWQADQGIIYGTHYLPHDADNKSPEAGGKSYVDILRKLWPGQRFVVVPRTPALTVGINQTRGAFSNCWFDKDECSGGIAALDAYRWKWNEQQQVFTDEHVHDRFSNFADAFRQFGQGYAPKQRRAPEPDRDSSADPRERRRERRHRGSWRSA